MKQSMKRQGLVRVVYPGADSVEGTVAVYLTYRVWVLLQYTRVYIYGSSSMVAIQFHEPLALLCCC